MFIAYFLYFNFSKMHFYTWQNLIKVELMVQKNWDVVTVINRYPDGLVVRIMKQVHFIKELQSLFITCKLLV